MKRALKKIALYVYPASLKLAGNFNVADLFIIGLVRSSNTSFYITGSIIFLLVLSAFQIIFYGRGITSNVLYVPVKVALIYLYFNVYFSGAIRINKYMLLMASLPLILSMAGFFSLEVNSLIVSLYGLSESQTWRYGGVFGQDVNSLGMYSTLYLILLYLSRSALRLNLIVFFLGICISLFCIVISGMRSGLITLFLSVIAVIFFNQKLIAKFLINFLLYIYLGIFFIVALSYKFIDDEYYDLILNRYTFDKLFQDFAPNGDGNLSVAINYFGGVVDGEFDPFLIMFGYDSSLVFVDNLFVFLFIKYGIFGLILTALFFIYIYKKAVYWDRLNNSNIGLFFIIYSFIISLKGIFPIAGYYVFLIILSMSIISQNKETLK